MAASGPENSVPAIGWHAKNCSRFGCLDTDSHIAVLVEPISMTNVFEPTESRRLGKISTVAVTGIAIETKSMSLMSLIVAW